MNDQFPTIVDTNGVPLRAQFQDTAHFAASRVARELREWTPPLDSANSELLFERSTIASRASDLGRNNGIASGALRTQTDNVVGTGLRLSAMPDRRVLGWSMEKADEWARNTEASWRTFANSTDFDAARQLTFAGMTAMMFHNSLESGEGVALPLWLPNRPGAKWKTAFQCIDAARLGSSVGTAWDASNRDGIEVNQYGEPISYTFRKAHPADILLVGEVDGYEKVPARTPWGRRRVIHLFEMTKPGQSRGKSILTAVMGAFRMLDKYQRIELQTVVANSMIAAFIETPMGGEDIAALFGDHKKYLKERDGAGFDVKLEGSSIIPLFPGDKVTAFNPTRPNTAYSAFVEAVLRYIAAGMHMPYELLMKDFSKTNYSSARAALLEAWRYFIGKREWLAANWCLPVYECWLEEAVDRGEVEAPGFYDNRAAYSRSRWIGPGKGLIDPTKESQASETRMKIGVSTLDRETGEQGEDWEETLEQRARERNKALSLGMEDIHAPPAQGGSPSQEGGEATPADDKAEGDQDDGEAVPAE